MGRFLNVTTKGFQESIQSEIYVDKTKMIALLNQVIDTEQKYVCVSRPRRFGKSMTIKMLSAYYHSETDSDPLFRNLKIAADPFYDKYRNHYEVVLINMQDFYHKAIDIRQMIQNMNIRICHELTKKFPMWLTRIPLMRQRPCMISFFPRIGLLSFSLTSGTVFSGNLTFQKRTGSFIWTFCAVGSKISRTSVWLI